MSGLGYGQGNQKHFAFSIGVHPLPMQGGSPAPHFLDNLVGDFARLGGDNHGQQLLPSAPRRACLGFFRMMIMLIVDFHTAPQSAEDRHPLEFRKHFAAGLRQPGSENGH